jgi:hypothetical protein
MRSEPIDLPSRTTSAASRPAWSGVATWEAAIASIRNVSASAYRSPASAAIGLASPMARMASPCSPR